MGLERANFKILAPEPCFKGTFMQYQNLSHPALQLPPEIPVMDSWMSVNYNPILWNDHHISNHKHSLVRATVGSIVPKNNSRISSNNNYNNYHGRWDTQLIAPFTMFKSEIQVCTQAMAKAINGEPLRWAVSYFVNGLSLGHSGL